MSSQYSQTQSQPQLGQSQPYFPQFNAQNIQNIQNPHHHTNPLPVAANFPINAANPQSQVQHLDLYRKISLLTSTATAEFHELSQLVQITDPQIKLELFLYLLQLIDIYDVTLTKSLINQPPLSSVQLVPPHKSAPKIELLRRLIQNCSLDWFQVLQYAFLPQQQTLTEARFRFNTSITTFPEGLFVILFRLFGFSLNFQLWSILSLLTPFKSNLSTQWIKEALFFLGYFCHPEHLNAIQIHQTELVQHFHRQAQANANGQQSTSQPPQPIIYDAHLIQLLEILTKFGPQLIRPQTRVRFYLAICHYFPTVRQHLSQQAHDMLKVPPQEPIVLTWVQNNYTATPPKYYFLPPINPLTTQQAQQQQQQQQQAQQTQQQQAQQQQQQQQAPRRLVEVVLDHGGGTKLTTHEAILALLNSFVINCSQQPGFSNPIILSESDFAPLFAIIFRTQYTLYQASTIVKREPGCESLSDYSTPVQQQLQQLFSQDPHVWKYYGERLHPYTPWDLSLWVNVLNKNFSLNWGLLFRLLDQPELYIHDVNFLEPMFDVWKLALTTLPSPQSIQLHTSLQLSPNRFPLELFLGVWNSAAGQSSVLKALQHLGGAHPMIDWAATPGTTNAMPLEDWPYPRIFLPNQLNPTQQMPLFVQTPSAQKVLQGLSTPQAQYQRIFGMYYNVEALLTLISLCDTEVDSRVSSGTYTLIHSTQRASMLWPLLRTPLQYCPEVVLITLLAARSNQNKDGKGNNDGDNNPQNAQNVQNNPQNVTQNASASYLLTPFGTSIFVDLIDLLISSFVGYTPNQPTQSSSSSTTSSSTTSQATPTTTQFSPTLLPLNVSPQALISVYHRLSFDALHDLTVSLCQLYERNRAFLPRLFDIVQELHEGSPLRNYFTHIRSEPLSIDFAILAAKRQYVPLESWLRQRLEQDLDAAQAYSLHQQVLVTQQPTLVQNLTQQPYFYTSLLRYLDEHSSISLISNPQSLLSNTNTAAINTTNQPLSPIQKTLNCLIRLPLGVYHTRQQYNPLTLDVAVVFYITSLTVLLPQSLWIDEILKSLFLRAPQKVRIRVLTTINKEILLDALLSCTVLDVKILEEIFIAFYSIDSSSAKNEIEATNPTSTEMNRVGQATKSPALGNQILPIGPNLNVLLGIPTRPVGINGVDEHGEKIDPCGINSGANTTNTNTTGTSGNATGVNTTTVASVVTAQTSSVYQHRPQLSTQYNGTNNPHYSHFEQFCDLLIQICGSIDLLSKTHREKFVIIFYQTIKKLVQTVHISILQTNNNTIASNSSTTSSSSSSSTTAANSNSNPTQTSSTVTNQPLTSTIISPNGLLVTSTIVPTGHITANPGFMLGRMLGVLLVLTESHQDSCWSLALEILNKLKPAMDIRENINIQTGAVVSAKYPTMPSPPQPQQNSAQGAVSLLSIWRGFLKRLSSLPLIGTKLHTFPELVDLLIKVQQTNFFPGPHQQFSLPSVHNNLLCSYTSPQIYYVWENPSVLVNTMVQPSQLMNRFDKFSPPPEQFEPNDANERLLLNGFSIAMAKGFLSSIDSLSKISTMKFRKEWGLASLFRSIPSIKLGQNQQQQQQQITQKNDKKGNNNQNIVANPIPNVLDTPVPQGLFEQYIYIYQAVVQLSQIVLQEKTFLNFLNVSTELDQIEIFKQIDAQENKITNILEPYVKLFTSLETHQSIPLAHAIFDNCVGTSHLFVSNQAQPTQNTTIYQNIPIIPEISSSCTAETNAITLLTELQKIDSHKMIIFREFLIRFQSQSLIEELQQLLFTQILQLSDEVLNIPISTPHLQHLSLSAPANQLTYAHLTQLCHLGLSIGYFFIQTNRLLPESIFDACGLLYTAYDRRNLLPILFFIHCLLMSTPQSIVYKHPSPYTISILSLLITIKHSYTAQISTFNTSSSQHIDNHCKFNTQHHTKEYYTTCCAIISFTFQQLELNSDCAIYKPLSILGDPNTHSIALLPSLSDLSLRPPNVMVQFQGVSPQPLLLLPGTQIQYLLEVVSMRLKLVTSIFSAHFVFYNGIISYAPQHLNPPSTPLLTPNSFILMPQLPICSLSSMDAFQLQSPLFLVTSSTFIVPHSNLIQFYPDPHRFLLTFFQLALCDIMLAAYITVICRTQSIIHHCFGTISQVLPIATANGPFFQTPTGQQPRPVVCDKADIHAIVQSVLTESFLTQRMFLHAKNTVVIEPFITVDQNSAQNQQNPTNSQGQSQQSQQQQQRNPAHLSLFPHIHPSQKDRPIALIPLHLIESMCRSVVSLNFTTIQRRFHSVLLSFALQVSYKHALYMFCPQVPLIPSGVMSNGGVSTQVMLAYSLQSQQQIFSLTAVPALVLETTPNLAISSTPIGGSHGIAQHLGSVVAGTGSDGGNIGSGGSVGSVQSLQTAQGAQQGIQGQGGGQQQQQQPQPQQPQQPQVPKHVSIKGALLPYIQPQHRSSVDLLGVALNSLTSPPPVQAVTSAGFYQQLSNQLLTLLARFSSIPIDVLVRYVLYHLLDALLNVDIQSWLDYQINGQKKTLSQIISVVLVQNNWTNNSFDDKKDAKIDSKKDNKNNEDSLQYKEINTIITTTPGLQLQTTPQSIPHPSTPPSYDSIALPPNISFVFESTRLLLSTLLHSPTVQSLQNMTTQQFNAQIQHGSTPQGSLPPNVLVQTLGEFCTRIIYGISYAPHLKIELASLVLQYFLQSGLLTNQMIDDTLALVLLHGQAALNSLNNNLDQYVSLLTILCDMTPIHPSILNINQKIYAVLTGTLMSNLPVVQFNDGSTGGSGGSGGGGEKNNDKNNNQIVAQNNNENKNIILLDKNGNPLQTPIDLQYIDLLRHFNPPIISLSKLPRTLEGTTNLINTLNQQIAHASSNTNTQPALQTYIDKINAILPVITNLTRNATNQAQNEAANAGPSTKKMELVGVMKPVPMSDRLFAQMQAGQVIVTPQNVAISLGKTQYGGNSNNNVNTGGKKDGKNSNDKNQIDKSTTTLSTIQKQSQQQLLQSIYESQRQLLKAQNSFPVGIMSVPTRPTAQNSLADCIVSDGFTFRSSISAVESSSSISPQNATTQTGSGANPTAQSSGKGNIVGVSRDLQVAVLETKAVFQKRPLILEKIDQMLGKAPYELVILPNTIPIHYLQYQYDGNEQNVQNNNNDNNTQNNNLLYKEFPNYLQTTHAIIAPPQLNLYYFHKKAPLSPSKPLYLTTNLTTNALHSLQTLNLVSTIFTQWFSLYLNPQAADIQYSLFTSILIPPQTTIFSSLYHFHYFCMASIYMLTLLIVQHPKFNSFVDASGNSNTYITHKKDQSSTSGYQKRSSQLGSNSSSNTNTPTSSTIAPPPSFGVLFQQLVESGSGGGSGSGSSGSSSGSGNTIASNQQNTPQNQQLQPGQSLTTSSLVNNLVSQILPAHLLSLVKSNAVTISHIYNGYIALILFICQHPAIPTAGFMASNAIATPLSSSTGASTADQATNPTQPATNSTNTTPAGNNDVNTIDYIANCIAVGDELYSNQGLLPSMLKSCLDEPATSHQLSPEYQARIRMLRIWCFALVEQTRVASTITNNVLYSYNTLFSYWHHHIPSSSTGTGSSNVGGSGGNNNSSGSSTGKRTNQRDNNNSQNNSQNSTNAQNVTQNEQNDEQNLTPTFYPALFGTFFTTLLTALHTPNIPSLQRDGISINTTYLGVNIPQTITTPTTTPTPQNTPQSNTKITARIPFFDLSSPDLLLLILDSLCLLSPSKYPLFFSFFVDIISHPALFNRVFGSSHLNPHGIIYQYFVNLLCPAFAAASIIVNSTSPPQNKQIENVSATNPSSTLITSTNPQRHSTQVYRPLLRLVNLLVQDYSNQVAELLFVISTNPHINQSIPQIRNILLSVAPINSLIPHSLASFDTLAALIKLKNNPGFTSSLQYSPLLPPLNSLLVDYPFELLIENPSHKDIISRFGSKYQTQLYQPLIEYFSTVHIIQQQQQQQQQHNTGTTPQQIPPFPLAIIEAISLPQNESRSVNAGAMTPNSGTNQPQQQQPNKGQFTLGPHTVFDNTALFVFLLYSISLGIPNFLQLYKIYHTYQQRQAIQNNANNNNNNAGGSNNQSSQQNNFTTNSGITFYLVSQNPTTEVLTKLFEILPHHLRLHFLNFCSNLLQWPSQSTFYIICLIIYLFHRSYYGCVNLNTVLSVELTQHPFLNHAPVQPSQPLQSQPLNQMTPQQQQQYQQLQQQYHLYQQQQQQYIATLDHTQQGIYMTRQQRISQRNGLSNIVDLILSLFITRLSPSLNLADMPLPNNEIDVGGVISYGLSTQNNNSQNLTQNAAQNSQNTIYPTPNQNYMLLSNLFTLEQQTTALINTTSTTPTIINPPLTTTTPSNTQQSTTTGSSSSLSLSGPLSGSSATMLTTPSTTQNAQQTPPPITVPLQASLPWGLLFTANIIFTEFDLVALFGGDSNHIVINRIKQLRGVIKQLTSTWYNNIDSKIVKELLLNQIGSTSAHNNGGSNGNEQNIGQNGLNISQNTVYPVGPLLVSKGLFPYHMSHGHNHNNINVGNSGNINVGNNDGAD